MEQHVEGRAARLIVQVLAVDEVSPGGGKHHLAGGGPAGLRLNSRTVDGAGAGPVAVHRDIQRLRRRDEEVIVPRHLLRGKAGRRLWNLPVGAGQATVARGHRQALSGRAPWLELMVEFREFIGFAGDRGWGYEADGAHAE